MFYLCAMGGWEGRGFLMLSLAVNTNLSTSAPTTSPMQGLSDSVKLISIEVNLKINII